MNKPKLIFFDIDDTLYHKATASIPDSVLTAFKLLKAQNIKIAIATGRGIAIFPDKIKDLIDKIGIDYSVTINGQFVLHKDKVIAHYPLTLAQIDSTIGYFNANQMAYGIMTSHALYSVGESEYLTFALDSLKINHQPIDIQDFDFGTPIYQLLAFCADNKLVDWQLDNSLKTINWHKHGVDILDKDGTKLRGIHALLNHLNIDIKDCMAFDDGLNDIEMIQNVGFGVAMGNACDELKSVADFVAPNIDDDGIFRALKELGVI